MKIVIENTVFDYDTGCRLLKLKHQDPPFESLQDIWEQIQPMTFKEIAMIENLEHRRVAVVCMGLERLVKEVEPVLVSSKTVRKTTTFVNQDNELVTEKFSDKYELFRVSGDKFGKTERSWQKMDDCYFVKFKDTSTDREYMCWIDPVSVLRTNKDNRYATFEKPTDINAIQSIAWTIQTNVPKGNIEEIIRQGDCILVKPKDSGKKLLDTPRHLTEEEYLTLLKAES